MMTNCPCCSNQMLRHIRHQRVYWFCRTCWQEMPVLKQSAGLDSNFNLSSLNLNVLSTSLEQSLAALAL